MKTYMKLLYEFSKRDAKLGNKLAGNFKAACFKKVYPALKRQEVGLCYKFSSWTEEIGENQIVCTIRPYILAVVDSRRS